MRNISDGSCKENQNKHFILNYGFRKSRRLRDNVEKQTIHGSLSTAKNGYAKAP
jgi:hypothetical protein